MMASMPEKQEVTSAALLKARKGNQEVKAESSTKKTKFGPRKSESEYFWTLNLDRVRLLQASKLD